jgi:hypothetical protein
VLLLQLEVGSDSYKLIQSCSAKKGQMLGNVDDASDFDEVEQPNELSMGEKCCILWTAKQMRHLLIQMPAAIAQFLFVDLAHDAVFLFCLEFALWYSLLRSLKLSEQQLQELRERYIRCALEKHFTCFYTCCLNSKFYIFIKQNFHFV